MAEPLPEVALEARIGAAELLPAARGGAAEVRAERSQSLSVS